MEITFDGRILITRKNVSILGLAIERDGTIRQGEKVLWEPPRPTGDDDAHRS